MVVLAKREVRQEVDESVFVSMTDIMISLLFIVVILMAFFAMQIRDKEATVLQSDHDAAIEEKVRQVKGLKATVALRDQQIEQLSLSVKNLNEKNEGLQTIVALRDQQIERLSRSVKYLNERIDELLFIIARLQAENYYISDYYRIKIFRLERENQSLSIPIYREDEHVNHLEVTIQFARERIENLLDANQSLKIKNKRLRREKRRILDKFLEGVSRRRKLILNEIRNRIHDIEPTIRVQVYEKSGVIRFDNRYLFDSGEWRVSEKSRRVIEAIADAIYYVSPCFTLGPYSRFNIKCNPEYAIIDAIQIEGHTDDDPTGHKLRSEYIGSNLELSSRRATETYQAMVKRRPELLKFFNAEQRQQPVLSVSAYGETRPIADNDTDAGPEKNRRIDLRFIMMTPQSSAEVPGFRKQVHEIMRLNESSRPLVSVP